MDSLNSEVITPNELEQKIENLKNSHDNTSNPIDPLFKNKEEYEEFKKRHEKDKVEKASLEGYKGDCFLGIDAGSTTTKIVLIDNDGRLLYSDYGSNEGNPLQSVMKMLKKLYKELPEKAVLRYSGVTGYGEKLIQTALNVCLLYTSIFCGSTKDLSSFNDKLICKDCAKKIGNLSSNKDK